MVSRTPAQIAAIVAFACALTTVATAQSLQQFTVLSFGLTSDTVSPRVDVPFHLLVTLRVRERVAQIENLDLPILAQLELLGDERQTTSGPQGTQYRESITVVAHDPGTIAISSATLQAIDRRDGRAKQWFTNGLTLHVAGAGSRALSNAGHAALSDLLGVLRFLMWIVLWVLGIGCLAAVVLLLFRRRRGVAQLGAPVSPAPEPAPAPRSRRLQATDALAVLAAERTRSAAIRVRAAIWRMCGASEGETLGDVLRRAKRDEVPMRDLLVALERSAFTYDADLHAAIDDTCGALRRYIDSP